MARYLHALKIEGIGDASLTTTDGIYRWCYSRGFLDNASAVDPDSIYKPGLLLWPEELSASVDFRDGRAASSSQTYRIRADKAGALWAELMRFRHTEVSELIADLTAAAVTIDVKTASLDGTYYLSREALLIDGATQATIAGGFRYTVARAQLGTAARAHKSGVLDDKYLYATAHVLAGRLVQLIRVDLGASTAYPEAVLWSGILRNVSTADSGLTIVVQVDSALQLVNDSTIMFDRCEGICIGARAVGDGARLTFHGTPNAPVAGLHLSSDQSALFQAGDHLIAGSYELAGTTQNGAQLVFLLDNATRQTFAGRSLPEDLAELSGQTIREIYSTRADASHEQRFTG
jgi:hypothetical protein